MSEENKSEVGGIAADRLRSLIERIEHLEEEKAAAKAAIKAEKEAAKASKKNK